MPKVVTPASSAWADWAWSSLDVMTTGVTAPSVMAVRTLGRAFARSMSSWCVPGPAPAFQARADECLARLRKAKAESGIDHVFIFPTHTQEGGYDMPRAVDAFRDVIIPGLAAP